VVVEELQTGSAVCDVDILLKSEGLLEKILPETIDIAQSQIKVSHNVTL